MFTQHKECFINPKKVGLTELPQRLGGGLFLPPLVTDMEFYVKCPQLAYGPNKMSTQVTTIHSVK